VVGGIDHDGIRHFDVRVFVYANDYFGDGMKKNDVSKVRICYFQKDTCVRQNLFTKELIYFSDLRNKIRVFMRF